MADLGLDKLVPQRPGPASKFNEEEWGQIDAARLRGVTWQQIQDHTQRYAKKAALVNAATDRRRRKKLDL